MATQSNLSDTQALSNQVDNLDEFAEFCHSYYTGCSRAFPDSKWEYGYDHEVVTMVELFRQSKLIVDAVVTDLANTSPDTNNSSSNPPSQGDTT